MAEPYLIFVIILFALAVFDLIVGVSNDAVNFLNSSIGSRVASRRTIMIVASIGIFMGAAFSSGMMEVARKGVFHPESFAFAEIMVIFVAVMLTDIILLDLFNTFGLPTSTTVSIVFELLGAAVAVSLIKLTVLDQGLGHLDTYINGANALRIVGGILLSVVFAFTIGSAIMFVSRLLFSFRYQKRLQWTGAVWGGLAMTAMTYFLLIKGMKNVQFIPAETMDWMRHHTLAVLGISFAIWSLLLGAIARWTRFNILRIVVLFGTFSLAMAFAGNDLVNFIGVPIAGFESYNAWSGSGVPADQLDMTSLTEPVATDPLLLFAAGAIMILTLWFSKKARSVTETEVKLGRQSEGAERFRPNLLARGIVRFAHRISRRISGQFSEKTRERVNRNFEAAAPVAVAKEEEPPDFDLVRASVNLGVASMLISFATSLKLPLSTTYVSFMVAMGASLADRAWGRDSAVFRVSGVLNVIGGWFLTAFAAFSAAGVFATLIYFFGLWAVGGLVLTATFLVLRSTVIHQRREAAKAADADAEKGQAIDAEEVRAATATKTAGMLARLRETLDDALHGLFEEDRNRIRKAREDIAALEKENEQLRYSLYHMLKRLPEADSDNAHLYLRVYEIEQDFVQSAQLITNTAADHIENMHMPLSPEQGQALSRFLGALNAYFDEIGEALQSGAVSAVQRSAFRESGTELRQAVSGMLNRQASGIREGTYNARNSLMFFNIALELRNIVEITEALIDMYFQVDVSETRISAT